MKKDREKIDQLIKETLTKEEAKFYEGLEEPSLFGKLNEVHSGKLGWLAIVMNIVHLVFFVLFIYCIYNFFNTEATKELIQWAAGGFLCMIVMGMLKLYIWMQIDKNDILRAIKRLELQVSALSYKTDI
ncbi:DUF6768 family protein [Maribacter sp. 2304DJ31-5]|uniref:DUF6768 family protein n=1 Tax=Maribacter sp. 2304DJ31-5 TaxID=3386273 RepID=UPI0039BCAF9D